MTKGQYLKQRMLRKRGKRKLIGNLVVIYIIFMTLLSCSIFNFKGDTTKEHVEVNESYNETIKPQPLKQDKEDVMIESEYPDFKYSKDWNSKDCYLLAKIAMAEAEGCDIKTKEMVILVVLNRVWSEEFPDTVEEVIFQEVNGVHQFTPVADGRWNKVEPNEECWEALNVVMKSQYDFSEGALYFESCKDKDNWHSRNLELVYEHKGMRFYK